MSDDDQNMEKRAKAQEAMNDMDMSDNSEDDEPSPGGSPERSPKRSPEGSPGGSPRRSRERSPAGSPDGSPRRSRDRSPAGSPDGSPRRSRERSVESEGSPRRSRERSAGRSPGRSPDQSPGRSPDRNDSKPEEEPLPETRIDVEIPKITTDLGKGIHFVKLPNFLSVETRPFDPLTYEDEIDDEETLDEEGRARLKLKVENTIRWRERFNDKGVFVKESNARFVRWSDGSLSLHLGSEIFNVHKQPLQGDHNHLFIRQGTGLQGQAVFRTKLTFRPHSTESFTHRKMTMSLADRSQKTSGIKVLSMVGHDPEAQRCQMIKKEEDKLRASVRRENKQRRVRERVTSRGLTTNYLESDKYDNDDFSDDDNAISLSAIKNRYKKNVKSHSNIYSSSDEDGDEDEGIRVKKSDRAKKLKDSDDEGAAAGSDDEGGSQVAGPAASSSSPEKEPHGSSSD